MVITLLQTAVPNSIERIKRVHLNKGTITISSNKLHLVVTSLKKIGLTKSRICFQTKTAKMSVKLVRSSRNEATPKNLSNRCKRRSVKNRKRKNKRSYRIWESSNALRLSCRESEKNSKGVIIAWKIVSSKVINLQAAKKAMFLQSLRISRQKIFRLKRLFRKRLQRSRANISAQWCSRSSCWCITRLRNRVRWGVCWRLGNAKTMKFCNAILNKRIKKWCS